MSDSEPPPLVRSDRPPPGRAPDVRPMSVVAAAGWVAGTTWLFISLLYLSVAAGAAAEDRVILFACQAAGYLGGLFLILRFHAPDVSVRKFLGLRATHPGFYPVAILLGVALQVPVNELFDVINARWPTPSTQQDFLEMLAAASPAKRAAIGFIMIALVPVIEEMFFRGAITTPLRRRYGAAAVVGVTACYFAVAHIQWQLFVPIFLVGLSAGWIRAAGGSIIPCVLLHATFNAIPFYAMLLEAGKPPPPSEPAPLGVVLATTAGAALLLSIVHVLGQRSEGAARAREIDLQ
jgi:uncharacterized protein